MIDSQSSDESSSLGTLVGWIAFVAALGCLAYVSFALPARDEFFSIYRDFHLELPFQTRMLLLVPTPVYYIVAGLLAVAVVLVQFRARSRNAATSFHLLVILLCLIAQAVYWHVMVYDPMMQLIKGMSSQTAP